MNRFRLFFIGLFFIFSTNASALTIQTNDYGTLNPDTDINFVDGSDIVSLSNDTFTKIINNEEYIFVVARDIKKGFLLLTENNRKYTKLIEAIPLKSDDTDGNYQEDGSYATVKSSTSKYTFTTTDLNDIVSDNITLYTPYDNMRWLIVIKKIKSIQRDEVLFLENYPQITPSDDSFWESLYYRKAIEESIYSNSMLAYDYVKSSGQALIDSIDATDKVATWINSLNFIYTIKKGGILKNVNSKVNDLTQNTVVNFLIDSTITDKFNASAIGEVYGGITAAVSKPDLFDTTISVAKSVTDIITSSATIGVTEYYSRKMNDQLVLRKLLFLKYYSKLSDEELFNLYGLWINNDTWIDLINKIAKTMNLYNYQGICANPIIAELSGPACIVYDYTWANDIEPNIILNSYNTYRDSFPTWVNTFKAMKDKLPNDVDGDGIINTEDPYPNNPLLPAQATTNHPPKAIFTLDKSSAILGDTITATSISSDPDGDNLTYSWILYKPDGSSRQYNNETSIAFAATLKGSYNIKLNVTDGTLSTNIEKSVDILPKPVTGHNLKLNSYSGPSKVNPNTNYCVDITIANKGVYDENVYAKLYVSGNGVNYESVEKSLGLLQQGNSKSYNNVLCYTMPSSISEGYFTFKSMVYSKDGDEDWSDNTRMSSARYGDPIPVYSSSYKSKYYSSTYDSNLDIASFANGYTKGGWGWHNVSTPMGNYSIAFITNSSKSYFFVKKNGVLIKEDKEVNMGNVYAFDDGNLLVGVEYYDGDWAGIEAMWPYNSVSITPNEAELEVGKTTIFNVNLGEKGGGSSVHYYSYNPSSTTRFNLDNTSIESVLNIDRSVTSNGHELRIKPLQAGTFDFVIKLDSDGGWNDYYFVGKIKAIAPPPDTDNDGVIDVADDFPTDPAASVDSDGDGYPDSWNSGKTELDSTTGLKLDLYPLDPNANIDSDGDGVADYYDAFPNNPDEQYDTDHDEVGNNADAFPNDPAASVDSDGDLHPDSWNNGKTQSDSTTGLTLDKYPNDKTKWESAPSAPTTILATDGTYTDRVTLSGYVVSGATSYKIYRAISSSGSKTLLTTTSNTNYDDTSVTPGTTYYYFVTAGNSAGYSGYSSYDTGYIEVSVPSVPVTILATDGAYTDKVIILSYVVSGATSYKIYRATSASGSKTLLTTTSSTNYDDTSVTPGTTYYYFVTAGNSAGYSDYSSSDTGYIKVSTPSTPTANAGTDQTVTQGSSVTLDALGSSDSDGTITSYKWSEDGALLSVAQTFKTSSLPVGRHTILLEVTDNDGLTATDEVIVTVNDALLKEYTINIDNNWTFVSLPNAGTLHVNDINNTHIKIIRSYQNGQWYVWTYNSQPSTEQTLTELTENNGYWIKSDAPTSINYMGNSLPAPIDFSTQNGKWKMYGSTQIDDPNLFFTSHPNITILWKYTNGAWQAISKDANISNDLDAAGIETLYFINSNEGFWAK